MPLNMRYLFLMIILILSEVSCSSYHTHCTRKTDTLSIFNFLDKNSLDGYYSIALHDRALFILTRDTLFEINLIQKSVINKQCIIQASNLSLEYLALAVNKDSIITFHFCKDEQEEYVLNCSLFLNKELIKISSFSKKIDDNEYFLTQAVFFKPKFIISMDEKELNLMQEASVENRLDPTKILINAKYEDSGLSDTASFLYQTGAYDYTNRMRYSFDYRTSYNNLSQIIEIQIDTIKLDVTTDSLFCYTETDYLAAYGKLCILQEKKVPNEKLVYIYDLLDYTEKKRLFKPIKHKTAYSWYHHKPFLGRNFILYWDTEKNMIYLEYFQNE